MRRFHDIDELRIALAEFRDRYNQRWIVGRLGYRTPAQARRDFQLATKRVLAARGGSHWTSGNTSKAFNLGVAAHIVPEQRNQCDHGKIKRLLKPGLGFETMMTACAAWKGIEVSAGCLEIAERRAERNYLQQCPRAWHGSRPSPTYFQTNGDT